LRSLRATQFFPHHVFESPPSPQWPAS
jgi:hypothetical protein